MKRACDLCACTVLYLVQSTPFFRRIFSLLRIDLSISHV